MGTKTVLKNPRTTLLDISSHAIDRKNKIQDSKFKNSSQLLKNFSKLILKHFSTVYYVPHQIILEYCAVMSD